MAFQIRIQAPDNQIRDVDLEQDCYKIGRAHDNDLCYPDDASLSRSHVKIERDGDNWTVMDLGSKNGTLLNGTRVAKSEVLGPGDRVLIGQLVVTFIDTEKETPENIVVFDNTGAELNPGATVMTSLEGLLSSEPTIKPEEGRIREQARAFELPVVRALIRAGRELAGVQPLEELFPLILELSIDAVEAERGILMTLEGDKLVSKAVHGDGFRISTTVRDRVLGQKTSLLVRDIEKEEALLKQLSISEQQIRSLMAVPLQTDNEVIGLIYVDSHSFLREFTSDDLNLLTVLANVAAIRIDHQRHLDLRVQEQRRDRDLQQAAEIQRNILPEGAPSIPGLDLAGHNLPCRTVGGDYYDFVRFADGRLAIVVADVAGKGMSAALLVASLQAKIELLMEEPSDLATLMGRLDRSLATCCPANRFVTAFLCVIDPATGASTFCNAGHNPALLVRASGEVRKLEPLGPVLGLIPGAVYGEAGEQLDKGDLLAIYSDGVTESENSDEEEFGEERLARLLHERREDPAEAIIEAVNREVDRWTDAAPPADDVTLVVVRRTA